MNNLNKLKEIALRFRLDSSGTLAQTARVKTIAKVLSDFNRSYQRFIEIEFFKNEAFKKINDESNSAFHSLKNDMELLVVDIKFDTMEISIAPPIAEIPSLFNDEVEAWKRESFFRYKTLLSSDFRNLKYMELVSQWYDKSERYKIYKPVFDLISNDYKVHIVTREGKVLNSVVRPDRNKLKFYLTREEQVAAEQVEKTYVAYVKLKKKGEDAEFKRSNIKAVYYMEEMEHDTYPYRPDFIQLEGASIFLKEGLQCLVNFDHGRYVISNKDFNVAVTADSREAAEQDFENRFYELYQNYYEAKPKDLSDEDKAVRKKLRAMVKSVTTDN